MPEISKPTQQFVEVKEIKDGVIYLKNGGLRQVLIVSGINFDLKSETEQNLILNGFQNFLNTLDFPVQFFIHSRKTNIDRYLEKMEERKLAEQNELLKIQIGEYIEFIRVFVSQNAIISKTFFVVVPYEPVAIAKKAAGIFNLLGRNKAAGAPEINPNQDREQLSHRVDQIVNGLADIGLRTGILNDEELIELFYNLYNPRLVEKKGLGAAKR